MDHVTVFRRYISSMGFSTRYGKKYLTCGCPARPHLTLRRWFYPTRQTIGSGWMFKIKPKTGSGFNETRPELGLEPNLDLIKTKITKKPYIYIYINFKPYPHPLISLSHPIPFPSLTSPTLTESHSPLSFVTASHHSISPPPSTILFSHILSFS